MLATVQSSCRLRRANRLVTAAQFDEAYAQQHFFPGRWMVLYLRRGKGAALRVGVVAGRKVGLAVHRARAKRRLREIYRRSRHQLRGDWDVVLVARRNIRAAQWSELEAEWKQLVARAGLCRV